MSTFAEQRASARRIFADDPTTLAATLAHLDGMERLLTPSEPRERATPTPVDRETAVRERVLTIRVANPGLSIEEAHRYAVEDTAYARGEAPSYSQADLSASSADDRVALLTAATRGEVEIEDPEPTPGSDAYFEQHPEQVAAFRAQWGLTDEYLALDAAGRREHADRQHAAKQAQQVAENRRAIQIAALTADGMSRAEAEGLVP